MSGWLILYATILWIANICFSAWLAEQKGRDTVIWAFLGFAFPGLAIIAIAGAIKVEIPQKTWYEKISKIVKDEKPNGNRRKY
jgi:hypothetical protein